MNTSEFYLTIEDKKALLAEARRSIEKLFGLNITPPPNLSACSDAIYARCGAFVTLNKYGQLRGCIGQLISDKPLIETVRSMAVSAARYDYRFPPVTASELDVISIEISVLSPLRKIRDISE